MDKQQSWLEWIKNLPQWLLGVITFVTAIIGFVNLFSGNYYRGLVFIGFFGLAALLYLCLKVAFGRDQMSLGNPFRFDQSRRRIALAGIVAISAVVVTLVVFEPSRSFMWTGFTSLPTPTPLALSPAQPGETLLLITDFDNRSGGKVGVDPAQRIYNLITEKLPGSNLKLRVEQYHQPMKDSAEARRVLKAYKATILIWGWYDQIGAEPTIELDKDSIKLNNPDLPEFNLATPESFVIRFTEEIPAQAGYTAFFTLGVMQFQLGINDVAKDFFTQAIDSAQVAETGAVNPWEALMWRGNIYSWSGEQDLAISDYTEALALYPHREGYYNRGAAYGSQGKYDLAIADYTKAIEIDPKYKEAYYGRGATYGSQVKYDLAIADYTKAIEIDPKDKLAYFSRGLAYGAQSKYDLAIADYTKAIRIDPKYSYAYNNRGNAYSVQGKYELAIADLTKAIEFDPKNKEAYVNRGNSYSIQGNYDLAIADFTKALEIDPNYKDAYFGRGNNYGAQDNYDAAIADYAKALEIDSKYKVVYLSRATAYFAQGKYDLVIADYTKAIEIDPKYMVAYNSRGVVYSHQGNYAAAIADYTKAIEIDPIYKGTYNNRGLAYSSQGEYDLAIADYTQAIEIDPNYRDAYNNRGYTYSVQGNYDAAIADYNRAVEIDPNFASAYENRGNAYANKRIFDKAIDDYQKSISLSPGPYTYCVLGITYTKIGDFPSAISNLEQGVQLDTKSEKPWCKTALDNARLGTPSP